MKIDRLLDDIEKQKEIEELYLQIGQQIDIKDYWYEAITQQDIEYSYGTHRMDDCQEAIEGFVLRLIELGEDLKIEDYR